MTRKRFMMAFFSSFFFPLEISQMKQRSRRRIPYVPVVFRFVGDGGGNFVAVGWKLPV